MLDALLDLNVDVGNSCGGSGTCGTCLVRIRADELPARNELEAEMASDRAFAADERLSCQIDLTDLRPDQLIYIGLE